MLRYSAAVFIILAAMLAACNIVMQKIVAEARNKAVEVCMDYNEVKALSAVSGQKTETVLKRLKAAGVNSVALEMDTIATAISKGHVVQRVPGEYELSGYSNLTFIPKLFDMVFGNRISVTLYGSELLLKYDETVISKDLIESIPIGFYDKDLEDAKNEKMIICGRIPAFDGADLRSINCILDYLQLLEVNRVIFSGDTIVGFRSVLKELGQEMNKRNLYFGKIEFSNQKGEQTVAGENLEHLIQVHSVSKAELAGLSPDTVIERYVRAVRERNVRLLYVRPIDKTGDDTVKDCCSFISILCSRMAKAGYTVKAVHKTEIMPENTLLKAVVGAGIAMGIIVLLSSVFTVRPAVQTVSACAAICVFAFMCAKGGVLASLAALILGICTPVTAVVLSVKNKKDSALKEGNLLTAAVAVLSAFCITMIGALFNLALLSDTEHIMRLQVYSGVKPAHILPLVLIALLCVTNALYGKESFRRQLRTLKEVFRKPVTAGVIITGFCLLVIVGLMLARSGNDAGIGVSAPELRLRSILDRIVYVRPRSKEFLVGYPALLIGFFFLFRNMRVPGGLFTVIGSIALVSLFNTFCHIHTPVVISIIRSANGLWCGLLAAFAAYFVFVRPYIKRHPV
ncbi:MAG: hypothetical protein ILO36_02070 [Abditibacteriota bacterium]|nr:hypothetical protein [Abditibacteriota bacterium]